MIEQTSGRRGISRRVLLAAPSLLSVGARRAAAQEMPGLEATYSTSAFNELMARAATAYVRRPGSAHVRFRTPVTLDNDAHVKQTLLWAVTGDLPDLSFQANNDIERLALGGLAQSLEALASSSPAGTGVASSVAQIGRVDGRPFGIPFQISVPICIVNLDLVARAGGDPANLPQDWPSLLALAGRIGKLGDNLIGGFFDTGSAWTFQALVTAAGGRMASPDGRRIAFDGPEGLAALQVVQEFGAAGMVDMSQAQAMQAFAAGTIGVLATSNNVLTGLIRQSADHFQVGAAPWPLPVPTGRLPAGGRTGVIFTKDPKRQAAAYKFLTYMTEPEVQVMVVEATGAVPVDLAVAQRDDLLGPFYRGRPAYQAGLVRYDALTGWYNFPGLNTVEITRVQIEHLRQVATGRASPEAGLREMARAVQGLLP